MRADCCSWVKSGGCSNDKTDTWEQLCSFLSVSALAGASVSPKTFVVVGWFQGARIHFKVTHRSLLLRVLLNSQVSWFPHTAWGRQMTVSESGLNESNTFMSGTLTSVAFLWMLLSECVTEPQEQDAGKSLYKSTGSHTMHSCGPMSSCILFPCSAPAPWSLQQCGIDRESNVPIGHSRDHRGVLFKATAAGV